jgi:hypothetical protein
LGAFFGGDGGGGVGGGRGGGGGGGEEEERRGGITDEMWKEKEGGEDGHRMKHGRVPRKMYGLLLGEGKEGREEDRQNTRGRSLYSRDII